MNATTPLLRKGLTVNYYNEWDKGAAAWLRELIKAGHLPQGYVDERSITEVTPSDLEGFTQCHFFAGIGGWPLALDMAGVRPDQRLWTGSPPCQPFSVAGKQLGQLDERHLAPTFMRLVGKCRPPVLFGEQVAAAIGKHWLDDLFAELEKQGYACGAAVLPAASVGAPHKRDRLFFGAFGGLGHPQVLRTGDRNTGSLGTAECTVQSEARERHGEAHRTTSRAGSMADTHDTRPQGRQRMPERPDQQSAGAAGVAGELAHPRGECERQDGVRGASHGRLLAGREKAPTENAGFCGDRRTCSPYSFWSDADWLACRDGKFRPVESGTFPLANGVSARVGRLRGYGNAIVPQVASEFIKAFTGACTDAGN